jgi:hypothetical protein
MGIQGYHNNQKQRRNTDKGTLGYPREDQNNTPDEKQSTPKKPLTRPTGLPKPGNKPTSWASAGHASS